MTTLTSKLIVAMIADLTNAVDLGAGVFPLNLTKQIALANGTGLNQADRVWHDTRTIAASGTDDLDLSGILTDVFGQVLTLARVKALVLAAAAANTNAVVIGAAAANAWVGPFGAATHTSAARPGGVNFWAAPDATGYPVVAGTGDILRLANGGGGTSVTLDIGIIGASA
ncbi:MAG TPA: hypothetical protein VFM54_24345 [Micromonosporaceae bacterium]|nr:hypothetical protein [Micromonosporaceae bacterium]